MSVVTIEPVEIESSDVIALLRKLEVPRNKMINHDVDWWRIDNGLSHYIIPSAPLVHGISYRTFKDKLFDRPVELDGDFFTVVDIEIDELVNWLNSPELTEARAMELANTGRKFWAGNNEVEGQYSYKQFLDFDSLETGKAFQFAHTSEMGWLPVFRIQQAGINSSEITVLGLTEAASYCAGPREPDLLDYTYTLECHQDDGSVMSLSGDYDNIANCLNILRLENSGVSKLQLTRKVVGPVVDYVSDLSLEDLL